MQTLPWLLVHGAAVWPIVLAALVLGGVVVAAVKPLRRARRAARAARDRLGAASAALDKPSDGMRVTLVGAIEIAGRPCARFEDGADAAAASAAYALRGRGEARFTGLNVRAEGLWLVVGEARIALEGPVEVLVGSREQHRGEALGDMPRAVQDRVAAGFPQGAPHFRDHPTTLRSIAAGDVVRVSGVLRRDALGAESRGYRGAAEQWKLVPDGEEAEAAAGAAGVRGLGVAYEGAPRVRGPGVAHHAKHALAGAAIGALLIAGGGEIAWSVTQSAAAEMSQAAAIDRDAGLGAANVASLSPLRRTAALAALAEALDRRHDEDAILIERRAALHLLSGDCGAAARSLARHGLFERGAEVASRCGDHRFAAEVLYAEGDFVRASDALALAEPPRTKPGSRGLADAEQRFAVRVHLLAGRADLAAREARAFADALAKDVSGDPEERENRPALARCVADALDARRGDGEARARLQRERDKPIHPACAIVLADLVSGKERLDLIHSLTSFQARARAVPMRWLELLEAEADPDVHPGPIGPPLRDPSQLVVNPEGALVLSLPAVERALAEALPARPADLPRAQRRARSRIAAQAAAFAAVAGEGERARRLLAIAADHAPSPGDDDDDGERHEARWDASHVRAVEAAVELLLGGAERASSLLRAHEERYTGAPRWGVEALLEYRDRRDPAQLVPHYQRWSILDESVTRIVSLAAEGEGDGAEIARWLRRPASEPGALLRFTAPSVRRNRDQLLAWIRLGYRSPGAHRSPLDQLLHWTTLAETASILGDEALAGALRERAARFRAALLRRELAIPLSVIERL